MDGFDSFMWNDGSTNSSKTVTVGGTYFRSSTTTCHVQLDTFHVLFERLNPDLGPDTFICLGSALTLDPDEPGAVYTWQDNSSESSFSVSTAGVYYVSVVRNGCQASDTITLQLKDPQPHIIEGDTFLCQGKSLVLHSITDLPAEYTWNNNPASADTTIREAGTYTVTATTVCGTYADEVTIEAKNCDCEPFVPTAFSPNQDGLNDRLQPMIQCGVNEFVFNIYNRFGQLVFQSQTQDDSWDGNFKGNPAIMGTYFYNLRFKTPDGTVLHRKGDITLVR